MLNETISAAMNATAAVIGSSWQYLKGDFLNRVFEIINAPINNTDMLWMLVPLLATIIFLEFYFGRYKDEELGWNTAYGNALVLLFISIDLFRHIYEPLGKPIREALFLGHVKLMISIVIMGFALLILFIDFFHFVPKKIAYMISSPTYLNFIALLGIIIVYSESILPDWTTLGACIVIIVLFSIITHIIFIIMPSYHPPLSRILEQGNEKDDEDLKKPAAEKVKEDKKDKKYKQDKKQDKDKEDDKEKDANHIPKESMESSEKDP